MNINLLSLVVYSLADERFYSNRDLTIGNYVCSQHNTLLYPLNPFKYWIINKTKNYSIGKLFRQWTGLESLRYYLRNIHRALIMCYIFCWKGACENKLTQFSECLKCRDEISGFCVDEWGNCEMDFPLLLQCGGLKVFYVTFHGFLFMWKRLREMNF